MGTGAGIMLGYSTQCSSQVFYLTMIDSVAVFTLEMDNPSKTNLGRDSSSGYASQYKDGHKTGYAAR